MNAATRADVPQNAWFRFWFRPTDPGTLGFMRIMTGLVVLYVHLAYIFDFQEFFGATGYWDLQTANDERIQSPVQVMSWGNEQPEQTITTPGVWDRRVAVFEFLKHLPEDKAQRDEVLKFLYFMLDGGSQSRPFAAEHFRQSLIAMQNAALLLGDDRAKVQAILEAKDYNATGLPLSLPGYFADMPSADRVRLWNDMIRLLEYTPIVRSNFNAILGWIEDLGPGERQQLAKFLRGLADGKAGRERIEFIETWRQDPTLTYAKGRYLFSLWFHLTNPTAMWVFHFIFIGIFLMFTVGLFTRVTSVLSWMAALFYIHRTQQVLFGMDTMMNILLFYLMIAPSGAAWSIDRLIARYRASRALLKAGNQPLPWAEGVLAGPRPSAMANCGVRLFQVHFCFIYAASGLAKLKGDSWWETTASWSTIANPEFCPFHLPYYELMLYKIASFKPLLAVILTSSVYFTLFVEISLPFLIWTRLRPVMIVGAIFLHTAIAWVMGLTCFGLLMMAMLLCYVPASVIRDRLAWPAGSGPRFSVRFNSRERAQARSVSLLRALDFTGQMQFEDEAKKASTVESAVRISTADGQTLAGYDGFLHGLKLLQFGSYVGWMLYVPGVSLLLRSLLSGPAQDAPPAPAPSVKIKTPSAR